MQQIITKIVLGILVAVVATVVAAKLTYEATIYSGTEPINVPWDQGSMEFVTWNGERWTAWVRDGIFELRPVNKGKWSPHANTTLAFINWEGEPWQVKIEGNGFLLAHRGEWKGPIERGTAIRYRDWDGKYQLRTLDQLRR